MLHLSSALAVLGLSLGKSPIRLFLLPRDIALHCRASHPQPARSSLYMKYHEIVSDMPVNKSASCSVHGLETEVMQWDVSPLLEGTTYDVICEPLIHFLQERGIQRDNNRSCFMNSHVRKWHTTQQQPLVRCTSSYKCETIHTRTHSFLLTAGLSAATSHVACTLTAACCSKLMCARSC